MKDQFVTYEIAKQLKELGFDEECFGYYHVNEGYIKGYAFCYSENTRTSDCSILAPLWQQVIDWFREKYNINILIAPVYSLGELKGYVFNFGLITMSNLSEVFKNGQFETFEEAREQAILKAIELCQKEK